MVPIARRSGLNERGQALVEYAVIVALVGACLVAILGLVGRATRRAYDVTTSTIAAPSAPAYPAGGGGGGGSGGGGLSGSVRVIPASSGEPPDSAGQAGSQDSVTESHASRYTRPPSVPPGRPLPASTRVTPPLLRTRLSFNRSGVRLAV